VGLRGSGSGAWVGLWLWDPGASGLGVALPVNRPQQVRPLPPCQAPEERTDNDECLETHSSVARFTGRGAFAKSTFPPPLNVPGIRPRMRKGILGSSVGHQVTSEGEGCL
jgi:hypothetical protein